MPNHKVNKNKFITLNTHDYHELLMLLAPCPLAFCTLLKCTHSKKSNIVLIKKKKLDQLLSHGLSALCCEKSIRLSPATLDNKTTHLNLTKANKQSHTTIELIGLY
ncbi:hypothetical protein AVI53_09065 [Piscirickettsia salmonis]|uniref:hypothetical protein n=1 Tax=Piscirickettsia salmonis TaxID=1238 RepID=UPI0004880D07|nr:hypothetical protein [Piscirickettsia salmonis]AKP72381.2 hypothetical protein PSLF89_191 [Piscirickettsia salmonis LF-89 = ATCC VR-1361]ALY03969.1 hypothetical protein AWE47_14755 [Piscirickettsia salmonis]AMA43533.1 hypothetical protein AWJ11_14980 [Piscirickettsia salmonis]AOS36002.1 hypothetical protein AVM72_12095 [Piscirickettsia salmonis]APS60704.1 hypothetical protein AVI53_09065 [Piscirickettsia salmonis]